ncbi:uncharacterized protein LOC135834649 [Planococcus citri]|uniref:uncharacterized protein LOC135834649 n=1 Tax=Planococcus citri TaxID=170843 RepID=UPI0031F9D295
MVKVKEFCCGCSLRTGTLIIAWISLVYNCALLAFVSRSSLTLYRRWSQFEPYSRSKYFSASELPQPPSVLILVYFLFTIIPGILASLVTIWAIQKNKAKYLNFLFWYLCYMVIVSAIIGISIMIKPTWKQKFDDLVPWSLRFHNRSIDEITFYFITSLFDIALLSYFALVVKSCRDYALRNEAQDVRFVGPDVTTIGYVAA